MNMAYKPAPDFVKHKGKDFVYELLVNHASNALCVHFQNLTQHLYNKYVVVCDKKQKVSFQNYYVVPHIFNLSYGRFIIQSKKSTDIVEDDTLLCEFKVRLIELVHKAIKHGRTCEGIKNFLKN